MKKILHLLACILLLGSANIHAQISGASSVCTSVAVVYSCSPTGGTWSSSNTAVITIGSASGVASGVAAGTATISYVSGVTTSTMNVTVNASPASITGYTSLCYGSTSTLGDVTPGGTWTSSNPAIASIGSASGTVSAVAAGVATITYTLPTGCIATTPVYVVSGPPGTLYGCDNLGVGDTLLLQGAGFTIGVYMSSNPSIAQSLFGGYVAGIAAGSATITEFSATTGCIAATKNITVTPVALIHPITGASSVCMGSTTTMSDSDPGGSWSSSDPTVAIISSGGVITSVAAGTTIITYTVSGATCPAGVQVYALPVITGPSTVCTGDTITLTGSGLYPTPGDVVIYSGFFTNSDTTKASLHATYFNSSVQNATLVGIATGTTVITFSDNISGCTSSRTETVNSSPVVSAITGSSDVCVGSTLTLTDTTTGGVWTSSNTNATVAGGIVTGAFAGTDTISYSVTTACGTTTVTAVITVDTLPSAGVITGASSVCVGASTTLADAVAGGIWSSTSLGTVAGGTVTGVSAGIDTIMYSVSNFCGTTTATTTLTINPLPAVGAITGLTSVCTGVATTLADTTAGGTWNATNSNATISGGVVTGVSVGVDTILYSVSNFCGMVTVSMEITVNTLPAAGTITGFSSVCVGSAITLLDAAPGGMWGVSNSTGSVSGGVVTGVSPGVDTISYTVTNMCGSDTATAAITINALPVAGAITGPSLVCIGTPITLIDTTSGGSWSCSNPGATVSGGIVTGVSTGTDTVLYVVANICGAAAATKIVTVSIAPTVGSISGPASVCVSAAITLTDAITGGVWSSSDLSLATIGTGGTVAGVAAGSVVIAYTKTNSCGSAFASDTITVNPLPVAGTISGPSVACVGAAITLAETDSTGTWSSSSHATVSGGVVTGVTAGRDTISYAVTNVCGTATATKLLTIDALPVAYMVTGGGPYCSGDTGVHIGLMYSVSGVSYQLYDGTSTVGSPLAGVGGSLDFGLFTAAGVYTILGTITATTCAQNMFGSETISIVTPTTPVVTVTASPGTIIPVGTPDTFTATVTGGGTSPSYQWYINGVAVSGATSHIFISSTFFYGDSVSCEVLGSGMCSLYGAGHVIITLSAGVGVTELTTDPQFVIYPNPNNGTCTVVVKEAEQENMVITVPDIVGRTVQTISASTNEATPIKINGPAGMYLVQAHTAHGTSSKKVVVENGN